MNEIVLKSVDLSSFDGKKSELELLVNQYKDLKINGIEDKEGFKLVDEARKILKTERVAIQKLRKELSSELTKVSKQLIEMENEIVSVIEPLEKQFKDMQDDIDNQKEIEKRKLQLPERKERLVGISNISDEEILIMDSLQFENFILEEKTRIFEEKERLQKEELQRMEDEKIKIQNEKDKIEQEKQNLIKQEEEQKRLEQIKIEAEQKAKSELEQKIEQDKIKEQEQIKIKQEQLNKQEDYKKFLIECGLNEENKHLFHIKKDDFNKVIEVYKFVNHFEYD